MSKFRHIIDLIYAHVVASMIWCTMLLFTGVPIIFDFEPYDSINTIWGLLNQYAPMALILGVVMGLILVNRNYRRMMRDTGILLMSLISMAVFMMGLRINVADDPTYGANIGTLENTLALILVSTWLWGCRTFYLWANDNKNEVAVN